MRTERSVTSDISIIELSFSRMFETDNRKRDKLSKEDALVYLMLGNSDKRNTFYLRPLFINKYVKG